MSSRSKDRATAVDILFEAEQKGSDPEQIIDMRNNLPDDMKEYKVPQYSEMIINGIQSKKDEIDELLATYAQNRPLDRMAGTDRNILRAGVWELVYNDDVPDAVAVDEAVTLSSKISTDESPRFINGLLGRIQDIKPTLS